MSDATMTALELRDALRQLTPSTVLTVADVAAIFEHAQQARANPAFEQFRKLGEQARNPSGAIERLINMKSNDEPMQTHPWFRKG